MAAATIVTDPAVMPPDDSSPALRSATSRQKIKALVMCAIVAVVTLGLMPWASAKLTPIQAFLPTYQTALIIAYVITGYLIYAQYKVTGSVALLYLAGGSFYTAAILFVQFLTFPAMFLVKGRVLGGDQSTIWLWSFWHIGPSLGIFLYITSEWLRPNHIASDRRKTARLFALALLIVFTATISAVTLFHDLLPILDFGGDFHRITTTGLAPGIALLTAVALVLLWRVTKFRTVLQLWLAVALFALLCDHIITMLGASRLSVGWYFGRFNALVSASVILFVYLAEINRAYLKSAGVAREMTASNIELQVKVEEARIDALTGLPGRSLFLEQAAALRDAGSTGTKSAAVLFIDLDGFKKINDQFGHDHGDAVLMKTAKVLRASLRDSDVAGRLGGDEFVVCLAAPASVIARLSEQVAERMVAKISEIGHGVGCSIGIVVCELAALNIETAIAQADEAMYMAKNRGRNRYVVYGRQPRLSVVA